MSWLFSRALVEEYLGGNCLVGARYAQSSGTPTPQAYCAPDKMTDFSRPSRFGMTFGRLTAYRGEAVLTWFLADSLAKTSAGLVTRPASTGSVADSGVRWREWLAKFDPATCSWRTRQLSLLEDSGESLETWPRSGMTRGGIAYQLPTLASHTSATGLGLLPTPTVQQGRNRTSGRSNPDSKHHDGVTLMDWLWLNVGQVKQKPSFVEWMMGWPIGWSGLQPLETDKYLNVQPMRGVA